MEHVQSEYEAIGTIFTGYVPSLANRSVSEQLRSRQQWYRRSSERMNEESTMNDETDETEHVRSELPVTFRVWSNRGVSERLRSRQRRYRRVSE